MRQSLLKYFVELTGHPLASSTLKAFSQSRLSQPLIRPFIKAFGINTDEMEYPISHYKNLHALFTRRLAENTRAIDQSPSTIVSPVDGVINDMGTIESDQTFYIKSQLYHLNDILGDKKRAKTYENGYFFILYLSPKHYHRMHYPIDGALLSRYALGEKSFPVNNLGMRWGNKPFSTNYRIISEVTTTYGQVAIVKVGALNINSIGLTNTDTTFKKGDEIGYFSFGSTVILLLENNPAFKPCVNKGLDLQVGQSIGAWA